MDLTMFKIMFRRLWVRWTSPQFKEEDLYTMRWSEKAWILLLVVGVLLILSICIAEIVILLYWISHITGIGEESALKNPEYLWLLRNDHLNLSVIIIALFNTPRFIHLFISFYRLSRSKHQPWYTNGFKALDKVFPVANFGFSIVQAILHLPVILMWAVLSFCFQGAGFIWNGLQKMRRWPDEIRQKNQTFLKENPAEMAKLLNKRISPAFKSHCQKRI